MHIRNRIPWVKLSRTFPVRDMRSLYDEVRNAGFRNGFCQKNPESRNAHFLKQKARQL